MRSCPAASGRRAKRKEEKRREQGEKRRVEKRKSNEERRGGKDERRKGEERRGEEKKRGGGGGGEERRGAERRGEGTRREDEQRSEDEVRRREERRREEENLKRRRGEGQHRKTAAVSPLFFSASRGANSTMASRCCSCAARANQDMARSSFGTLSHPSALRNLLPISAAAPAPCSRPSPACRALVPSPRLASPPWLRCSTVLQAASASEPTSSRRSHLERLVPAASCVVEEQSSSLPLILLHSLPLAVAHGDAVLRLEAAPTSAPHLHRPTGTSRGRQPCSSS
eukprot:756694-Hanusia_phi.AAC.3